MGNSPCSRKVERPKERALEAPPPDVEQPKKVESKCNLEDVVKYENVPLEPDTFGMMICSVTRDTYYWANGTTGQGRAVRLVVVVLLLGFTMFFQCFLLAKVKQFVSAKAVYDIREAYGKYEAAMCEENTYLTAHKHARCKEGAFPNKTLAMMRLEAMTEEDQESICKIPLSQPWFFASVLLIWTLTCFGEIRRAFYLQILIYNMRRVDSMKEAEKTEDMEDEDDDPNRLVIRGMTNLLKALITITTFVPRVLITVYLCWVGSRWLLATASFTDLILNAVALEFILLMKEGVYHSLMPTRSKRDLELTEIHPGQRYHSPKVWNFIDSSILLLIAMVWVWLYITRLQTVLKGYNHDIQEVCLGYIADHYRV